MNRTVHGIRPDRVAIYIRWSTDDQGDGTTAEVQLEGCRHYLLSQGWTYRPDLVFVDDGYSGGDLNRPALTRLRRLVEQGGVDCVVLFKIDRLSRNVVDTVNLVLREWEGRCYVKSAREPIDTTTAAGKMFFYTLVSFAEWERSVIRERTLGGKLRRLQEGRNPGFRPPYGLRTGDEPGSFALVPEEAEVVRLLFDRYVRGSGCQSIAAELNRQGIPFRDGRPWSARTVGDILRNPIYAGRLVYGRRMANPRRHQGGPRQVRNPDPPLEVASPLVPPIVDPATFSVAQRLRAGRAMRRQDTRSAQSDHLLTGLLRCRCRSSLVGIRGPSGAYYVCSGKRTRGPQYCDAAHIRQDELDRWLVERLLLRHGGRLQRTAQRRAAARLADSERRAMQAGLIAMQKEVDGLDRELARVSREYRRGRITLEEYREHRGLIRRERDELLARRERLQAGRAAHQGHEQGPGPHGFRGGQVWEALPHPVRKRLLRSLIHRLTVYRAPKSQVVQYELEWVGG